MLIDLDEEHFRTGLDGQPSAEVPIRLQVASLDVFHEASAGEHELWTYDDSVEFAIRGLAALLQARQYGFATYPLVDLPMELLFYYRAPAVLIRYAGRWRDSRYPTVQVPFERAVRTWETFGERVRELFRKYIPPELLPEYQDGPNELAWLTGQPVSTILDHYGVPRTIHPRDIEYFAHVDGIEDD